MTSRIHSLISVLAVVLLPQAASSQGVRATSAGAIEDPDIKQAVSAAAVRYGRLVLLGTPSGLRYTMPSSVYTSERGNRMTVQDGRLTQLTITAAGSGKVSGSMIGSAGGSGVASSGSVASTPASITFFAVQSFTFVTDGTLHAITATDKTKQIPDGTYRSEDGKQFVTIVEGKPTSFVLPYVSEGVQTAPTQPAPTPIRR